MILNNLSRSYLALVLLLWQCWIWCKAILIYFTLSTFGTTLWCAKKMPSSSSCRVACVRQYYPKPLKLKVVIVKYGARFQPYTLLHWQPNRQLSKYTHSPTFGLKAHNTKMGSVSVHVHFKWLQLILFRGFKINQCQENYQVACSKARMLSLTLVS